MKSNSISYDEYVDVIRRLDFIKNEEKMLKDMNRNSNYHAHVDLPGTFGELLIYLKRRNDYIMGSLDLFAKMFINDMGIDMDYTDFVDNIINDENFLNSLSCKDLNKVKDLIVEKKTNDYFYKYIEDLVNEEKVLISRKYSYENGFGRRKKKLL